MYKRQSLAGIFPLAGFWSKDEILLNALDSGINGGSLTGLLVFILGITAVFLTAFYMFRALFMTFEGEFRGGSDKDPESKAHGPVHLAEPPYTMLVPMVILAVPAIAIGFIANSPFQLVGLNAHWMSHFLDPSWHGADFNIILAVGSSLIAFLGILLAFLMYKPNPSISPSALGDAFKPLYILLHRKYYFDELYEDHVTKKWFYRYIAGGTDWIDRNIVDKVGLMVGFLGRNVGGVIGGLESGQIQAYGTGMSMGVIIIVIGFMLWA